MFVQSVNTFTLTNSQFYYNSGPGCSLLVVQNVTSTLISHSNFVRNTVDFADGAVLYVVNGGQVVLQDVNLDNNWIFAGLGGAIYASSLASLEIYNSYFVGNGIQFSLSASGNVLYGQNIISLIIANSTLFANGFIYDFYAQLIVVQSSSINMRNNTIAFNLGGSLTFNNLTSGSLIADSTIVFNTALTKPMLDVSGCDSTFYVNNSLISYNLGMHPTICISCSVLTSRLKPGTRWGSFIDPMSTDHGQLPSVGQYCLWCGLW